MDSIVTVVDGQAVTTTFAIAKGTNNEHASVIALVRKYLVDLEQFGPCRFEIVKGKALPQGGFAKATEYAILNEQQSTLLLTLMRNSEVVVRFKVRLVREFWEMAKKLRDRAPQHALPSYPEALRMLAATIEERGRLPSRAPY